MTERPQLPNGATCADCMKVADCEKRWTPYWRAKDWTYCEFLPSRFEPSVGEPCPVCGSKDHVCTPDIPGLRHCPYTSSSETLLRPQATTAENSHSQNPSNNCVSGTGGDLDGE